MALLADLRTYAFDKLLPARIVRERLDREITTYPPSLREAVAVRLLETVQRFVVTTLKHFERHPLLPMLSPVRDFGPRREKRVDLFDQLVGVVGFTGVTQDEAESRSVASIIAILVNDALTTRQQATAQ